MRITFYGAVGQVTGSCFLIEGQSTTVLVDCGLFQGSKFADPENHKPLPFACGQVDHVLITHAHLDHTGRLPKLCMEGFTGKIYATLPTIELTQYLWEDALEIMEIDYQETGHLPLYTPTQVRRALRFFKGVGYGQKIKLSETDHAVFHDAGHILGSAFIELVIDGKRVVFSGDVGNVKPPIIRETEQLPANIDLLVTESTYGNRAHETKREREKILFAMVNETLKRGGTLMIPSFAIERTQEILYLFNKLINTKVIPPVPIFLDSPLAIKVTRVFQKYPEFYNPSDLLLRQSGDDLFDFPNLTATPTRRQSRKINRVSPPKIIIAGSGMLNGGRISYHLQRYLPDPKSTLFIVGYQAEGTLGRSLLQGKKTVRIFRKTIPVRAHVHAIGSYSAHADQTKLLAWMRRAEHLKTVALTHGDQKIRPKLAKAIQDKLKLPTLMPKQGRPVTI